MTARTRIVISTTAFLTLIIAIVTLAVDSVIAARNMNPVPIATSAITRANWNSEPIVLESYSGSGRLFGSVASVKYRTGDGTESGVLFVELRRPFLRGHWEVVTLEKTGRE